MGGDWKRTTIGEQVTLQRGVDITKAEQRNGNVPVISSGGISSYHDTAQMRGPGVVLGRKGVVGSAYYVKSDYWAHDTTLWVKDFHGNEPRFVYYFFKQMAPRLSLMDVGSANPTLNRNHVHPIEILWPPIPEQRAIAHTLGTLDDKIELNRRINEALDASARAIFKSWFVDFDPVRAKARAESPASICRRLGLALELLAFFPDRLVDSELGEIPEGWEVKSLDRLTSYLNRGISPKYIEEGGVLVLNQKCVRGGRIDVSKARRHDPVQRSIVGRVLEVGDILVNSTGVGTLGRMAQVLGIEEPTIVDSHVTVVRTDPAQVSWNYLGVALQAREPEIEALGEGSTGQTELSRVRLGALPLLVPPKPLRDHFDDTVLPLRLRAKRNDEQNVILASLRDALLPKLISGELRVPLEGAT